MAILKRACRTLKVMLLNFWEHATLTSPWGTRIIPQLKAHIFKNLNLWGECGNNFIATHNFLKSIILNYKRLLFHIFCAALYLHGQNASLFTPYFVYIFHIVRSNVNLIRLFTLINTKYCKASTNKAKIASTTM